MIVSLRNFIVWDDGTGTPSTTLERLDYSKCFFCIFSAFALGSRSFSIPFGKELDHSTQAMTMDTYSHLSKEKAKTAVSFYEKAVSSL